MYIYNISINKQNSKNIVHYRNVLFKLKIYHLIQNNMIICIVVVFPPPHILLWNTSLSLKHSPSSLDPSKIWIFQKIKFFLSKSQCTFLKDNRHRTEHFQHTKKTQGKSIITFYTGWQSWGTSRMIFTNRYSRWKIKRSYIPGEWNIS